MAFIYKQFCETTLPSSVGTLCTNGASKTGYIRLVSIHNGNTTAETVKLYKVPNNGGAVGTASAANEILNRSIEAGGDAIIEFAIPGRMMIAENDSIQGETTTASKVSVEITGGEE